MAALRTYAPARRVRPPAIVCACFAAALMLFPGTALVAGTLDDFEKDVKQTPPRPEAATDRNIGLHLDSRSTAKVKESFTGLIADGCFFGLGYGGIASGQKRCRRSWIPSGSRPKPTSIEKRP